MTKPNDPRWPLERVRDWWDQQPWICGFNFLPSTAVNFLEMWTDETFDRDTIDRELGWAASFGFNSIRTNLHYLVWKNDRDGLIERFQWFLDTARKHGMSTMPVLFDDCGFGGFEPVYGPQPAPIAGLHNSRAVASPGRAAVMDRAQWPDFEAYVRDIISQFRDDAGVLLWDLYNEPSNLMVFNDENGGYSPYDAPLGDHSRDLMCACFDWARDVNPSQPLTVGAWRVSINDGDLVAYDNEIDQLALAMSDVVTFHAYTNREKAVECIAKVAGPGRPMLNTEWVARTIGSQFTDQLELYHDRKIGCYNWGMVQGRTQTHIPWPHIVEHQLGGKVDETRWFHDVLKPNGAPYDPAETQLVSDLTALPRAQT